MGVLPFEIDNEVFDTAITHGVLLSGRLCSSRCFSPPSVLETAGEYIEARPSLTVQTTTIFMRDS